MGVKEPQVAFSACYSAAFLVRHPTVYAKMLAERLRKAPRASLAGQHRLDRRRLTASARASNWRTPGPSSTPFTPAQLNDAPTERDPYFKLDYCTRCPGVPEEILRPAAAWKNKAAYESTAKKLAALFSENFAKYADKGLVSVPAPAAAKGQPELVRSA